MSWLRLDDGFAEHPKIAALSDSDAWRWVRTLLYCARRRDPELPIVVLERVLGWDGEGIDWLVSLGLLDEHGSDERGVYSYAVHDWHAFNGAASGAERTRAWRQRKYGEDYGKGGHGGRRGTYAGDSVTGARHNPQPSNPHGYVKRDDGVTVGDESVTSLRARAGSPSPEKNLSELQDVARAREDREDSDIDFGEPRSLGSDIEAAPLDATHELEVARLLAAVGALEPVQADALAGYARRAPEAVLARVRETLAAGGARDRYAYALGALRREAGGS